MTDATKSTHSGEAARRHVQAPQWVQNAVATLVVAGFVAMVSSGIGLRISFSGLSADVKALQELAKESRAFRNEPRFTRKNFERAMQPIQLSMQHMEKDIDRFAELFTGFSTKINGLQMDLYRSNTRINAVSIDEIPSQIAAINAQIKALNTNFEELKNRVVVVGGRQK